MKRITATGEAIDFRLDAENRFSITSEGVLVKDEHAVILQDRLCDLIKVEDVTLEQAAEIALEPTVPEEQPAEEVVASVELDAEGVSEVSVPFEAPAEEVAAPAPKKGRKSSK